MNRALSQLLHRRIIIKPEIDTRVRFYARWRGYVIDVTREGYNKFYITVTAPDGSYSYDGWFKKENFVEMHEAVSEAIKGACIFKEAANADRS